MKKILLLAVVLSGCASMNQSGDPLTEYQKQKPGRKLSGWFLVDLLFPPFLIVVFSTGKIYRMYPKGVVPYPVAKTVTKADLKKRRRFEREYDKLYNQSHYEK